MEISMKISMFCCLKVTMENATVAADLVVQGPEPAQRDARANGARGITFGVFFPQEDAEMVGDVYK